MLIYHGTSLRTWERIQAAGRITPRGDRPSTWDIESNPRAVYLTDAYAPFYGLNALNEDDPTDEVVVVEINTEALDPIRFVPDEDAVEQMAREDLRRQFGLLSMEERTAFVVQHVEQFAHLWKASLAHLGTCAYEGDIPLSAVTGVWALRNSREFPVWSWCDPTITLANYKVCGAFYRNVLRFLVGLPIRNDDITGMSLQVLTGMIDHGRENLVRVVDVRRPVPDERHSTTA
jgi:hypothetical protein